MATTTKIAQECERCQKRKILALDILQDKWLCDDCFILSYCEDCGDLLEGIERMCCSICRSAVEHKADIDWEHLIE